SAALGNSAFTTPSYPMIRKQLWPVHDGDHDILHSFGTPLDFNSTAGRRQYLHEGVDISASGKRVDAAQGGVVGAVNNPPNINGGGLQIDVDWGPPANNERITYQHTVTDPAWNVGDTIAAGDDIGNVNTTFFGIATEANHVHWGTQNRNILLRYTAAADRDPNVSNPVVADINNDGEDFIVVDAAANDHSNPRNPAWGEVDFLVDAYDDMAANLNLMVNPHQLGYWIQSGVPGGENVRSAADPYSLVEFDFFLPGPEANQFPQNAFVYWGLPADLQGVNTWQSCLTWILTNTRGADGAQANIDAGQFWKTDARIGAGAEPNGSDADKARENQEARFPDGMYYVHILLNDFVNNGDFVRPVLVDNSRPYVKKVSVYSGLGLVSRDEWIWDGTTGQLEIHPAAFEDASTFPAERTQDITIEIEFSEPMQTAAITSLTPKSAGTAALGVTPTLTSTQPENSRAVWKGVISNLDIADDGSHDGYHFIGISGKDLAGNDLLQVNSRSNMGPDHHNRNALGNMQGTPGQDNVHGFRIGHLEGEIAVTAIFMKQTANDPATPGITTKALEIRNALNAYFDEVSYGDISFAVTGLGWYPLNHALNWYYSVPQTPLIDLVQEAIDAALTSGASLSTTQFVLVVTDETSTREEWATNGPWPYTIPTGPGWQLMASGVVNLASDDPHITNAAGRMVGLVDLFAYPYVTYGRDFVGAWSHMSDKAHDVHVMGWEKWRAGWIDETGTATSKTITHVDKPAYATPIVNQTYTLLPLNNNVDGAKAVAIEIGDGLHYTAEYRRQDGLDNGLPAEGVLVVKANDYIKQGEGPAIVQNATVTTTGLSQATYTTASGRDVFDDAGSGVNIEVTSMNANQAEIRLNYQVPATENDVYVSPHDERWEALDIWVDAPTLAGDFEADPLNVINANEKPVVGSVNMVYGRVRNQGHADATNFEVHLEILEPWGTGSTWHTLEIETVTLLQGQDHASNDYYLISSEWTPTAGQHTCVKLKIRGLSNDINLENNWTQENINQFVTTTSSPYEPVTTRFQVENPYAETKPVFFRIDGLPPQWSYILTPSRLVLPAGGVEMVQVTLQPHNEAPLCSEEVITVSAYTPWVDALTRLGAVSLQTELKSPGVDIFVESWAECERGDYRTVKDDVPNVCTIYAQGCTDPGLPNTEIAIVYTNPNGQKSVHYVMTDENGCFWGLITAAVSGEWEVQAVIEEQDCTAGSESPEETVDVSVDDFDQGKWALFANFGPNFPVGGFNDAFDPGFSFSYGIEREFMPQWMVNILLGYHQFYSPVRNQHFTQLGANLKYLVPLHSDNYIFLQAGAGYYLPRFGNNAWGFNSGVGSAWIIQPRLALGLGINYHYINQSTDLYKQVGFITVPFEIKWRF
ncbi:MAG: peptidoglycan DD-metalloendopeptidase family protein, partial [Phaeodactylibacter sp.]|nr:peptidoglycan DD-metalloendopeptidase family protein [Phaeodactylibacter sp.]